jgi:acetyl-CoA acetyltransferase
VGAGSVDFAELHTRFEHEEPLLRRELGLSDEVVVNASGGPRKADPVMATGLIRIGEAAVRIHDGSARRTVAHAASGPCLQHNLVCVLEAQPLDLLDPTVLDPTVLDPTVLDPTVPDPRED